MCVYIYIHTYIHILSQKQSSLLITAVTVGLQSLSLALVHQFLLALNTGTEPWNPGILEPAVGLQSWVNPNFICKSGRFLIRCSHLNSL